MEDSLIGKTFYQTMLQPENTHPIKQLGELFLAEQMKEIPDASYIRYAQGELYYHHHDYEAAIYKWENVHNELEPWAKKNMADAYTKMELLSTAEEIYKSIVTDSPKLKMEILLCLYSLYLQQENFSEAEQIVKEMVEENPDYSNVTDLARNHYEQQNNWFGAINLAIQEGTRTESIQWFEVLDEYVQKGHTVDFDPKTFIPSLSILYKLNFSLFEQLLSHLWKSYERTPHFFQWLKEAIPFILNLDRKEKRNWQRLPSILQETYEQLISGMYFYSTVSEIVPDFLRLWITLASEKEAVLPSAAIFAWYEKLGEQIPKKELEKAEKNMFDTPPNKDVFENVVNLTEEVEAWAEKNKLEIHQMYTLCLKEIVDLDQHFVGIMSAYDSDQTLFIHSILNEYMFYEPPTSITTIFRPEASLTIEEITENETRKMTDFEQFQISLSKKRLPENSMIRLSFPNKWLKENRLTLIDLPGFTDKQLTLEKMSDFIKAIDSLMYYCDNDGLDEKDLSLLKDIQRTYPNLPILYVIKGQNGKKGREDSSIAVKKYLADNGIQATVFPFTESGKGRRDLGKTLNRLMEEQKVKTDRPLKYVYFSKKLMDHLFTQREKMENELLDEVHQKEDLASRLTGAIHQLKDLEEETITKITLFYERVKEEMEKETVKTLPRMLKEKANTITNTTDFHHIVEKVNEEMNMTIHKYITDDFRPNFLQRIQEWLVVVEEELKNRKTFFDEMNDGFSTLVGERNVDLPCDFHLIDDWRRDVNRLSGRFQLEKKSILSKRNLYQMFLVHTGKMFDVLKKDKSSLTKRFQQFVKEKDYTTVAQAVIDQFFSPFTIFEAGIEQDVNAFFQPAFERFIAFEREVKEEIAERRRELEKWKEKPEFFRDPLKFFEIRRLQFEFLLKATDTYEPITNRV
ncbi:tetratricopeptide repeat protein [Fervidibacillus albus]|uniref:GTP-binding protein n=1 Tax=Fervidibacillus albus TaxID=2980026 RepID=A0A9E8RU86_9BACI|nr:hypothetical protein [Fervidibacillus albus]WAA09045.1 hypothetical protein OE104_10630 [Fervidibacillus albus]